MKYTPLTTEEFITKASHKHDARWDYSQVVYVSTNTEIDIVCPTHGVFRQTPKQHLKGLHCCIGCKQDTNNNKFIEVASKLYNDKYDYNKVVYVSNSSPVIVTCPIHGDFNILPINHLKRNSSCSKCKQLNVRIIIERAKLIHGNQYDYSELTYSNGNTNSIQIICKKHGLFNQNLYGHLRGQGCRSCDNERKQTNIMSIYQFIAQADMIHGNKYDYSEVEYIGSHDKIRIKCKKHGIFYQTPNNHLSRRTGCPSCGHPGRYDINRMITDPDIGQRLGTLYLIRLFSDSEIFHKIGISLNPQQRFSGFVPYNVDVVATAQLTMLNANIIEQNVLTLHDRYTPSISFGGHTECLTLVDSEISKLVEVITNLSDSMEFKLL